MKIAINVTPLKTAHKDRGIGNYTLNLINSLKGDSNVEIKEFTNLSDLSEIDIVHYPWFDFYFQSLPFKKIAPTVVTIHDTIPLRFKDKYPVGIKGKINFHLQKISLKKCKAIITDSNISKRDIINFLKIDAEKIKVIPLAADNYFKILPQSKLIQIKRKYNLQERFILYVGDVNWVKNLPLLIKSFKEVTDNSNFQDLKLVLVGGSFIKKVDHIDHPELKSLKEVNNLILDYNLENKVIRMGKVDKEELVCLYNLASLYVQPSLFEGFGLPVLEAMTCGAPVVCSNAGSLPEVGGEAVVYFDPNNLSQLSAILLDILGNKSLQDKLSQLGLKQAEKFSWEEVAKKTLKVYSNVTNS